jgi:hypothetical protein
MNSAADVMANVQRVRVRDVISGSSFERSGYSLTNRAK